jgi:hypothetical protein
MIRLPAALALAIALIGCAGPQKDDPALVPMDSLLGAEAVEPAPTAELQAQGNALRARADALRSAQP